MAQIKAEKYSVNEAFLACYYVVPDYQREYVWKEKDVTQLLDDISEQIASNPDSEYFVGTVLVSPGPRKNHYEVIDGQQRLTTFFLILCALRNRFKGLEQHATLSGLVASNYVNKDGSTEATLRLEPRYENAAELVGRLVALDAGPEEVRDAVDKAGVKSFGSLENLLSAYETIHRYLGVNYAGDTPLKALWGYLANSVVFIQISTDVSRALKIFETINKRGVSLDSMDLLKNLLFTSVDPGEFTKLKGEWKKITGPLEKEDEKPLRFLRYYLMANYEIVNDRGDAVVQEDEIYSWFVNKKNADLAGYRQKPFEFVTKVIRNAEHYLAFAADRGPSGDDNNEAMKNLRALTGETFSLHYVLLLAAARLPPPLFGHLVKQLEKFLFYYIFTKTPTKELERNFSSWADELRGVAGSSGSGQAERLDGFIAAHFETSMAAKAGELTDALRRYTLNSMQKYRTRYLLAKLAQHVEVAFKGLRAPGPLGNYTALEIEHILPNTPSAELRAAFAAANPGTVYDECKIRLGNLTLLEKPLNIVAGNGFYAEKKAKYKDCGQYLTRSLVGLTVVGNNSSTNRMNEGLKSFNDWTATAIEERQGMLIALVMDVWKISLIEGS